MARARQAGLRPEAEVDARGGDRRDPDGRAASPSSPIPIWYKEPEKVVATGVAAGLDGLEVFHVDQDGQKENEFGRLAERQGLLKSAGSDYHGPAEGKRRVGACRLDAAGWERMVSAAHARRAETGRPPLDLTPR